MGKKIFISYKYGDNNVAPLARGYGVTTARHYVDELEVVLSDDNIYKGESADEPLDHLADATIQKKLYDRIYDSSATLVLVSPNMRETWKPESQQWIAQEIAYSLSEHTRGGTTSHTNAMLAVVLPDATGSYSYYMNAKGCCASGCTMLSTDGLFPIHTANMFNKDGGSICSEGSRIYYGEHSFVPSVAWCDFVDAVDGCLTRAYSILDEIKSYTITKTLT